MKSSLIVIFTITTLLCKAQFYTELQSEFSPKDSFENVFTNIPLEANSNRIEVYVNGEIPQKSYYKVRLLEKKGTTESSNELLAALKVEAKALGFDGLLLIGDSYYPLFNFNNGSSFIESGDKQKDQEGFLRTHITNIHSIVAVGIKYKSNMSYVNKIPKKAIIELSDENKTMYEVYYNLSGKISHFNNQLAELFYRKNIYTNKYPDEFWLQRNKLGLAATDIISEATSKYNTDSNNIKYTYTYNISKQYLDVLVKIPKPNSFQVSHYNILYKIDSTGLIISKAITEGKQKKAMYVDTYHYDSINRCSLISRLDANSRLLFTIKYEFFTENDLPEIL